MDFSFAFTFNKSTRAITDLSLKAVSVILCMASLHIWLRDQTCQKSAQRLCMQSTVCRLFNTRVTPKQVPNDSSVRKEVDDLQIKYIIIPVDKAPNNITFVCGAYILSRSCAGV